MLGEGLLAVGRFIKDVFTDKECKCCRIYEGILTKEREEKYLLYQHIGIVRPVEPALILEQLTAAEELQEDMQPVQRKRTLSSIRQAAEAHYRRQAKSPTVVIAPGSSLTEAENIFQKAMQS